MFTSSMTRLPLPLIGWCQAGPLSSGEELLSVLHPTFRFRVASTGAELNLDNALSIVNWITQATPECHSYNLTPVFEARPLLLLLLLLLCLLSGLRALSLAWL